MASGVSGVGGYNYLGRMRQSQNGTGQSNRIFGKLDTNRDDSISKDEWSAFQSRLQGSGSTSALSLLNLLQSPAQSGTSGGSTSSANTGEAAFTAIDTNGDGAISKDELCKALFGTRQKTGETASGANSQGVSSKTDTLFSKIDTNGDGSLSKEELAAFRSTTTAQFLNRAGVSGSTTSAGSTSGAAGAAAFIQQALGKYMQLTPAGRGIAAAGSFLGIG